MVWRLRWRVGEDEHETKEPRATACLLRVRLRDLRCGCGRGVVEGKDGAGSRARSGRDRDGRHPDVSTWERLRDGGVRFGEQRRMVDRGRDRCRGGAGVGSGSCRDEKTLKRLTGLVAHQADVAVLRVLVLGVDQPAGLPLVVTQNEIDVDVSLRWSPAQGVEVEAGVGFGEVREQGVDGGLLPRDHPLQRHRLRSCHLGSHRHQPRQASRASLSQDRGLLTTRVQPQPLSTFFLRVNCA
jgi:hypothetical protein